MKHLRLRLALVGLFFAFLFSLLIVRYYTLQGMEHKKWVGLATKQHEGVVKEPFRRGTIWSNPSLKQGHPYAPHPIVLDLPRFHLHADPTAIPNGLKEEVAQQISGQMEVEEEGVLRQLRTRSRNRSLVRWLDHRQREALLAWWRPFSRAHGIPRNALFFCRDYQRSYPFGSLLGQVLHTIRDYKDEATQQGIPTGGLEASLDGFLQGEPGERWVIRSPRHRLALGTLLKPARDGAEITLTIHHYLQAVCEEALERGLVRTGAKQGWAILADPHTGEIWALAQAPAFYPERYRDYFNDPDLVPHTVLQAATSAYEPGSVMKPLILSLCLKANEELRAAGEPPLFDPDAPMDLTNGWFPGRERPLRDLSPQNEMNLERAIAKSSNIYPARLVEEICTRLGPGWLEERLRNIYGFGTQTGLELPSEATGWLPNPHSRKGGWSGATPASLAMGYNLLATSLQLIRAYSILANGGHPIQLTLLKEIIAHGPEGDTSILSASDKKKALSLSLLSQESCQRIHVGMEQVVSPGGSGRKARLNGFSVAGKSGTAEKVIDGSYSKTAHFTTFIGFSPAEDPLFVLLVSLDEPERTYLPGRGFTHYGGASCAPIFREIAQQTHLYLGSEPLERNHEGR